MLYISGIHALNIENSLNTCGDWHCSSLNWGNVVLHDSDKSRFKDWGIEYNKHIPESKNLYNVANDLRAILDLLEDEKNLGYLKGFYNDFICTDEYNSVFFEKVYMLKKLPHWGKIDSLMSREFLWEWDKFKKERDYE